MKNFIVRAVLAIAVLIAAVFFLAGGETMADKSHSISHYAGMCEGENCDASTAAMASQTAECATDATECVPAAGALASEECPPAAGDVSKLAAAGSPAETGNCAAFNACSIDRNLNGASGEELQRYQAERAEDGKTYANLPAPAFSLPMTDGSQIALADFKDRPLAIVTLSVHCYHSMETLPLLKQLKQKYADMGVAILPVFVNATGVEDIQSTIEGLDLGYPVAVAQGKALSEAFESRMVPSTFLINGDGRITQKLVGQKDQTTLENALGELLKTSAPSLGVR